MERAPRWPRIRFRGGQNARIPIGQRGYQAWHARVQKSKQKDNYVSH
jgi:hypothetical protein